MARVYDFDLPYTISGIQDEVGIERLQVAGLWNDQDIPADLQQRMSSGEGLFGNGATITQQDLNRLSDRAWAYIAQQLGLQWHTEATS